MRIICVVCLLLAIHFSYARQIAPGATVANQLNEAGNTQIDYATGILNYNVPLFSVEQDGFNVPFSLNYHAQGIKVADQPGLAGLGWSLSTGLGGIVRIIRGCAADEESFNGILHHPIPTDQGLLPAHIENINSGKIDGESDLFILRINGATVHFVLTREGNQFVPKPLHKTNVSIKCIYELFEIKKWEVIDGKGNYYEITASLPDGIFIRNNTPKNSSNVKTIMAWYITRIKLFNNDEIKFIYGDEEYAERSGESELTQVTYTDPLVLPNINDQNLRSQLEGLKANYVLYANHINNVQSNLDAIRTNMDIAKQTFYRETPLAPGGMNVINKQVIEHYNEMLRWQYMLLNSVIFTQNSLEYSIANILYQMFYSTHTKTVDRTYSGSGSITTNRLLRKILFRNGEIDFHYKKIFVAPEDRYSYSKIEYKNLAGDKLQTVYFNVNSKGYLTDVQWANNKNVANKKLNFSYHLENAYEATPGTTYARDYWGYYNGKTANTELLPYDAGYINSNGTVAVYPFWGGTSIGTADRKPDESLQKARSLKSVMSHAGEKIEFDYEANQIFNTDIGKNIVMGGLRIKSLTVNDGSNSYTTTYKYAFPQSGNLTYLKSTGRLNEWMKKNFTWNYYYYPGGNDIFNYSSPRYLGTLVYDNSNNGVVYHYVEEIKPDGSAIGYKFPEVHPMVWNTPVMEHNPDLDRALLATIYYNQDGHIVKLNRKKYSYPTSKLGNRNPELQTLGAFSNYFSDQESITGSSIPQIKREPEHYNQADLLDIYPNTLDTKYSMQLNMMVIGINPYSQIYGPNYAKRLNHNSEAISYSLPLESALLLREEETFDFADYDLAAAADSLLFPSLVNERPYLYERLIRFTDARRVRNSVSYGYNLSNPLYPNIIRTVNSNNVITIQKRKFSGDYQLPATDAISALQQQHCLDEVIEEQVWKSIDNGTTYKMAGSTLTDFEKITENGVTCVVPAKKYRISSNGLLQPSSLGYSETYSMQPPYTSLFWEGANLYRLEESTLWRRYKYFIRPVQTVDVSNSRKTVVKYDEASGAQIMETAGVDVDEAIAADFSRYQRHAYYADKYALFTKKPAGLYVSAARTFDYLSGLTLPELISGTFDINTLDHVQIANDVYNRLVQFENNYVNDYLAIGNFPLYSDIKSVFFAIKEKRGVDQFAQLMLKCLSDYLPANQNGQYGTIFNTLYAKGINFHAIWYYIQWLSFSLKTDHSAVQGAYHFEDVDSKIYEPRGLVDYNSWQVPKEMRINVSERIIANRYLNLYMVHDNNFSMGVNVKAVYADGSLSSSSFISFGNTKRINTTQLDIHSFPNYSSITGFRFTLAGGDVETSCRYFAAVPVRTLFNAYAYLPNGKFFLKFDQNGEYVEYVYDSYNEVDFVKRTNGEIAQARQISYANPDLPATRMVDVTIVNNYSIENGMAPKIWLLSFGDMSATYIVPAFFMDVFPSQVKVIQVPAAPYRIDLGTEPGNYTLRFNGVVVPSTTTGVSNFLFDLSNGQPLKIEITKN